MFRRADSLKRRRAKNDSVPRCHAGLCWFALASSFALALSPDASAQASFTTPVANNFGNSYTTTGTINPGVIWVGSYFQVGLEATIPVNRESGSGLGVLGQLHLYLDDMFRKTVGQPLFGGTSAAPRKLTF